MNRRSSSEHAERSGGSPKNRISCFDTQFMHVATAQTTRFAIIVLDRPHECSHRLLCCRPQSKQPRPRYQGGVPLSGVT